MTRLYMIETKSFYKDFAGYDVQVADGGVLPLLYTSFAKAVKAMENLRIIHVQRYNEVITDEMSADEDNNPRLRDRVRFYHEASGLRTIVSLYEVYTL